MAIFDHRFYEGASAKPDGAAEYRGALVAALSDARDREQVIKEEAVAITRTITDGIRDLIKRDKKIRHQVLDLGVPPLSSWAAALDKVAGYSLEHLKHKIEEMERELEHGHIGGFPGTMLLYGKPTFTTFRPFYEVVFAMVP